ncbi:ankyrin repeat-containing protein, putative [Talaromyces stipitatus ATCC 10500]|uniref:Ankyrin repeat-containing protein, putative n=1 Tax=Talaromyces stipitatus (strain ATCC 10500 / CBS 375.48 / QM 6759 / NRRL 1006) TaxID=441959 RepID=B8LWB2_TALSN|nr:ankyrin repeat-containing protein, putative [Talaromyces stipitatus ATCC 10500]EED24223.1 ankyrin repeat-containing protein, putative [Talaromyces stipitatus ATCC 10500]
MYFFFKDNDEQNNLTTALCAVLHQLFSMQSQLLRYALPFWERNQEKIQFEVDDMWRIFMATTSDPAFWNTICVFDALDDLRPDRETIPPLPKNVPEAYERILNRVPSDQKAKVETILQIIVGARRPLTVQEMAMALGLATTLGAETAKEAGLNPSGLDKKIRQLCGLFVFIKESKIYVIHQTAREFLISKHDRYASFKWCLEQRKTEIQMTEICVKYLLMNDVVSDDRKYIRSLLDYSAENWADNFRDVLSPEDGLVDWVWRLYDVTTCQFHLWFPNFWKTAMPYHGDPKMEALHLAAFNGHQDIVRRIALNERGAIDKTDRSGTNAFQWACVQGCSRVVEQLLEMGANANAQGKEYGNALQAAAARGHLDIVQRLIENGANINAEGGDYHNAFQAAAAGGHLEIVQQLIENGADVNAQGGKFGNALYAAVSGEDLEIVQRLLKNGADVNAQGGELDTVLQAAARGGHLETVKRLLENGANINAEGGDYHNALQAAAAGDILRSFKDSSKMEHISMLSTLLLLEEILRLFNNSSKMEQMSMLRVKSSAMHSKLLLLEVIVVLYRYCRTPIS